MKICIEPTPEYVKVTIDDDADAREFWRVAAEVVSGDVGPTQYLAKLYKEYGDRHAEDNTALIDWRLWNEPIRIGGSVPGVTVCVPFSVALLGRLGVLR